MWARYLLFGSAAVVEIISSRLLEAPEGKLLIKAGYDTMYRPVLTHIGSCRAGKGTLDVLWNLRHPRCGLPHDRIFALLSTISVPGLRVSYDIPGCGNFAYVTRYIVQETGNLRVIGGVRAD